MAETTEKNLPAMQAGGKVGALVPSSFNEIVQIAGAVVRAGMAPKSLDTTEKATVAIMHGMELGLTPMAALQSIAVINGTPATYGDGMLALCRASGHLEDIKEDVEWGNDGPLSATCEVKRRGEKTPGKHIFTRDDAIKANLWKKAGPWTQYPQRMLAMRARAWALRDKFADVLRGLHSAEEIEDMVDVTRQGSATVPTEPKKGDYVETPKDKDAPAADPKATNKKPPRGKKGQQAAAETTPPADGTPDDKKPGVTDAKDLNDPASGDPPEKDPKKPEAGEKLEFSRFTKTVEFMDFAEGFLPETNTEGAIQFMDFYDGTLIAMDRGKPLTQEGAKRIREMAKGLGWVPPDETA